MRGSFGNDGRTTPTATRVEGLTAALGFLPSEATEIRSEIELACRQSVAFLVSAQYPDGDLRGGLPQAIGIADPPLTESAKRRNGRSGDVRVDYVQHAMSAWIQWLRHAEATN